MLITSQPTHAYDYAKIHGAKLGARMAKDGEKITLLNDKTYTLTADDIVIADAEAPVGLAGIMGGGESEVEDKTTDIVLEVANFDMYTVRKSAMKHGVFTDALTRFNKGQSSLQNDRAMALLIKLVTDIAGGTRASDVMDNRSAVTETRYDRQSIHDTQTVSAEFINTRLGLTLSAEEMSVLLKNVEIEAKVDGDDLVSVTAERLSITSLALVPPAISVTNLISNAMARSFCREDCPLLKRVSASVNTPCFIADLRTVYISKFATSRTISVVLSSTSLSPPPIIPARPTGASASAITISSAVSVYVLSLSNVIFSPSLAIRAPSFAPCIFA
jgi:hypothetical protein